jgi:hypothetical protein
MIPLDLDHPTAIELSIGANDAVVAADVSAAHRLANRLDVGVSVGAPLAAPDLGDGRAAVWLRYTVPLPRNLALPLQVGPAVQLTTNDTFTGVSLLTEAAMYPGWYGKMFSVAADLEYRAAWLTHIESSDYYEEWVYDAPDGWYAATGQTVRAGVRATVTHRDIQFGITGGWQHNGKYAVLLPPVYAVVDTSMRF